MLRRLRGPVAVYDYRLGLIEDGVLVDDALLDIGLRRYLVHGVEHHILKYGAKAPGPGLSPHRLLGDRRKGPVRELEKHILELEELLVLLDYRVLGLHEYLHEVALAQLVEHSDHREPAHELRYQAVAEKIPRLDLVHQHGEV